MGKIRDVKERVHQPFWDTLARGIGITTVANLFQLFGNANVGQRANTNLQVAGQFASDSHFIIKAMRAVMAFQGLDDVEFDTNYGAITGVGANATSSNARAQDLYTLCAYGSTFTLTVGNKPMLSGPTWYLPAGGGPFGQSTQNARHVITMGVPTHTSILKLAKDITVSPRQNFSVAIEWFPFARLGNGQGGAMAADVDPLLYFNQFDGLKLFQMVIDGVLSRDVQ